MGEVLPLLMSVRARYVLLENANPRPSLASARA